MRVYLADIIQSTDYSPFGVQLSGRNFTASGAEGFRYGFQNQEEDDEIKGEGNSLNYTFRMHDPRLGRFFAIDPLAAHYVTFSPNAFAINNPISYIDVLGLGPGDPKKVNVMITTEEGSYNELSDTKQANWVIIKVDNIRDAANKVEQYCKDNNVVVGNLAFVHHGKNYGHFSWGSSIRLSGSTMSYAAGKFGK